MALLSGISGSGPSRSNSEASQPSAIDKRGDAAVRVDEAVEQGPLRFRLLHRIADDDEAAGQDLDVIRVAAVALRRGP